MYFLIRYSKGSIANNLFEYCS